MRPALRILLAEDNPGDVFLVEEALRQHAIPHELTVATDGDKAWKWIDKAEAGRQCFDLFMLDLNLPIRPGIELLNRIRSSAGKISKAPILIMTSSDAPRDRSAAARGGASYYFRKPSSLDEYLTLGSIVEQLRPHIPVPPEARAA